MMGGMIGFVQAHGWEIARLTFEHLWLTGFAMLLAAAIGVPLGILLTRKRRLAGPVIAVANVVQTIPSLALFGLLLPVPWLGENAARLAILALTGYALLPILRNTYAGVGGVDPALLDVSKALGMSGMAAAVEGGAAAGGERDSGGAADRDGYMCRRGDDCGGDRRGRAGGADLSRRGERGQRAGAGGGGAGGAAGAGGGYGAGDVGEEGWR